MAEFKSKVCCSFCGKGPDEVAKLVAGPSVFICDACVGMCQLYIEYDVSDSKLLIEDGKPVMKDGKPVFEPLTQEEIRLRDELLAAGD